MSWRLGIRHTSAYSYVENVVASYNEVRITPLTTVGQVTIDARVEVRPPARPVSYRDYWGTLVHAFDIHVPHRELVVVGSSIVETPLSHGPTDHHAISWAELGDDAVVDPHVDRAVDPFDRVEHASSADDEVLLRCVLDEEHQATSIGISALTGLGPVVSRS